MSFSSDNRLIIQKEKQMTVKELIEILSTMDQTMTVAISVEHGRGVSGSDEVSVSDDDDVVYIGGEETFYD